MSLAPSEQILQLMAWFIVLLAGITALYTFVINFGGTLNRYIFLLAAGGAIFYSCLGLLIGPINQFQAERLALISLVVMTLLRPVRLIVTILLLKPDWWSGPWGWLIRFSAGLNLLPAVILLLDIALGTGFYYGGLKYETQDSGFAVAVQIIPGSFYPFFNLLSVSLGRELMFIVVLYIALVDKTVTRSTRLMAWLVLGSFSSFVVDSSDFASGLVGLLVFGLISVIGFLAAILIKLFSEQPFQRGGLQFRLLSVAICTALPGLIAVGFFSRRLPQAFLAGIILVVLIVVILAWLTLHYNLQPLSSLTRAAAAIAAGDLMQVAPIKSGDEIGLLAQTINGMTVQLRNLFEELEQRLAEHTRELNRRTAHLEISSRVGQHLTAILDQDALLDQVVTLLQAGFGYYFVSIWLLTAGKEALVLQAGAGHGGKALRQKGFRISMNTPSIIVSTCKMGVYRLENKVAEAPDYLPDEHLPDTRSELCLPLRGGGVIGVLDIQNAETDAFRRDELVIFQLLADEIAVAIQNAQLYAAEQRRRQFAEVLERLGRELSSSLNSHEIPGRILARLADVVPYERCAILLQQGNFLQLVAQRGFPEDERVQGLQIPIRRGDLFQQVVGASQPVLVENVAQDSRWQQLDWLPLHLSWLGVPLISQDRVIGMISLTRPEAGAFSDEDARLVSVFAVYAAMALENASLYDEIARLNEGLEQTIAGRTEELNKAYQHLERLDQTKSDFINVVARELRTPLTVIRGYTQVMRDIQLAVTQEPENAILFEGILSGTERMHEIVDGMLDLTQLENQTLRMHPEKVSLARLIGRVAAKFEADLKARALALTLEGLEQLPFIQADPNLLAKAFYHLIMNAIKYVPDGGAITVTGMVVPETENGRMVEVVVSDTGIGIDPDHHELIFEKFYQTGELDVRVSGQDKFKGGGPGLGLAIVQGIVVAHKGRIWVESVGRDEETYPGSHFHIQLPLNET